MSSVYNNSHAYCLWHASTGPGQRRQSWEMTHKRLLRACRRGKTEEALQLLSAEPWLLDVKWEGKGFFAVRRQFVQTGMNCILAASASGQTALLSALIALGADLNARGSQDSLDALGFAAENGHADAVALILDKREVDANNRNGTAALHLASMHGHKTVCRLLIARKGDLNANWDQAAYPEYPNMFYPALTCLERYGHFDMKDSLRKRHRDILRTDFLLGPHPTQIKRRRDENWARRWAFVQVMVGHGFQPSRIQCAALEATALPTNVRIPRLPCKTLAQYKALLRDKVLTERAIWRLIAAYI